MRVYTFTFFMADDGETTPEEDLQALKNGDLGIDDLIYLAESDDPDYALSVTVRDEKDK